MIEKMSGVNSLPKRIQKTVPSLGNAERAAIREMVKSAKQPDWTLPARMVC